MAVSERDRGFGGADDDSFSVAHAPTGTGLHLINGGKGTDILSPSFLLTGGLTLRGETLGYDGDLSAARMLSVEIVRGTREADDLAWTKDVREVTGWTGNDTLDASGGRGTLIAGGGGSDVVTGSGNADVIWDVDVFNPERMRFLHATPTMTTCCAARPARTKSTASAVLM